MLAKFKYPSKRNAEYKQNIFQINYSKYLQILKLKYCNKFKIFRKKSIENKM